MRVDSAFVVVSSEAVVLEEGDHFCNNSVYFARGYTPPLFRRSRLRRFARYAQRAHLARAVWRWSRVAAEQEPATFLVRGTSFFGIGGR